MITILQLMYVCEIEKRGSLSAAATSLYITQPTLSSAIKELESNLGYKIFTRDQKGSIPTTHGAMFIAQAKTVLKHYSALKTSYLEIFPTRSTTLKISSQHYAFLSEAINIYIKRHQCLEYNFVVKECKTFEVINDVFERKCDIGFVMMNDNNSSVLAAIFEQKAIQFKPLFNFKPHAFVNTNHPLTKYTSIALEDLYEYPTVVFEQEGNSLLSEELILQTALNKVIYVSDRATLMTLIANTDAYNIGTGYLSCEMKKIGMKAIPINNQLLPLQLGLIYLEEQQITQQAQILVRIIKRLI